MNSKAVGDISVAVIISVLIRKGHVILLPFGDNQRYDLVIESKGKFERLQVKTGHIENGRIDFNTASTYGHRNDKRRDYRGQADKFAVFVPAIDKIYLVPVEDVGKTEGYLRLEPPKNGQIKGVRFAKNYEL